MSQIKVHQGWYIGFLVAWGLIGAIATPQATAQITPDSTLGNEGSRVIRNVTIRGGNADRIDGGATRGSNLFHSFLNFNVNEGQRVYFANPVGVQNILTRVTGNTASDIMGTLGVDGSANLFVLNPNGIIFGPNAQLDISGSFTASTANSFTFPGGSEFSAANPGDSSLLSVAVPLGVQYGAASPGAIANAGNLSVGQSLSLSGGSVTSSGQLAAPAGQLLVEGVAGDVQVRQAIAQTATLTASNNLILQESQLQTAGDLNLQAGNTVQVRDSVANPFVAYAGGDLTLQGNQAVDIFALNHPQTQIQSNGNLSLISDGIISGDTHFNSGGSFSMLTLQGNPGTFVSLNDPVISSNGNVVFGNYTGAALKVEATGSIEGGNIRITQPDCVAGSAGCGGGIPTTDPDFIMLTTTPSVILRAGSPVASSTVPQVGVPNEPTDFIDGAVASGQPLGSIRVGNIDTSVGTGNAGSVVFSALGTITTNAMTTAATQDSNTGNNAEVSAGDIRLTAGGDITINGDLNAFANGFAGDIDIESINGEINTQTAVLRSSIFNGQGGAITLNAGSHISTGGIETLVQNSGNAGEILLKSRNGSINVGGNGIDSRSQSGDAGNISLEAPQESVFIRSLVRSATDGSGQGGDISINANSVELRNSGIDSATSRAGQGGDISINANSVELRNSGIDSATSGTGQGGAISINAAESVRLVRSDIRAATTGDGNSGGISIQAESLNMSSNSALVGDTNARGRGGDIFLNVTGETRLVGGETAPTGESTRITLGILPDSIGSGGNLTLRSGSLFLQDGAIIKNSVQGLNIPSSSMAGRVEITASSIDISGSVPGTESGLPSGIFTSTQRSIAAGDVVIRTDHFRISDGAIVGAGTQSSGIGGTITVRGMENNFVDRFVARSGGQLTTTTSATGRAGNIEVHARHITLTGSDNDYSSRINFSQYANPSPFVANAIRDTGPGSGFYTSASNGSLGNAGNIRINANRLVIDGNTPNSATLLRNRAQIRASSTSTTGGNIRLQGLSILQVRNGGSISASTQTGRAGSVAIDTDDFVEVSGEGSRLAVEATRGRGRAGNLTITTDDLTIQDGAEATVSSKGEAGNLTVNADSIELDNGSLTAIARSGSEGNIDINMSGTLFQIYNRSTVTAGAENQGNGGSVNIRAENGFVLANPYGNSDILANANAGRGGDINITTNVIFGLEERDPTTDLSDINAASQFNSSGSITLNTLNVDPTRGLGELPVDIVDTAGLVADGCVGRNRSGVTDQGEFTQTGRGGLSANPDDPLTNEATSDRLATLEPNATPSSSASIPDAPIVESLIVEAQGLGLNSQGKVSLVSNSFSSTPSPSVEQPATCATP